MRNFLLTLVFLMALGIYGCNDTASKEDRKDSTSTMQKDTTMKMGADSVKMSADTIKTDTGGKGIQTPPPHH